MITLDAVRAALAVRDPYEEMDRLVRAELSAGRRVRDVYVDLGPLVESVRRTPGLSADGEEALLGTLDALTGNCDPDQCYADPPTSLPAFPAAGPVCEPRPIG